MHNAGRFAVLGVLAGLIAPAGLLLYAGATDGAVDPMNLFLATVAVGAVTLGFAGWRIGRKDDQLLARNRELQTMAERLQELSTTDSLTGIPNRRALDERLSVEMARTQRYRTPMALVMIDLDHFKLLNDRHGHLAGDVVLRRVAEILDSEKRMGDLVARYGGEEFAAVLPHSDGAAALAWAERARARIANTLVPIGVDKELQVTASFGVAVARIEGETRSALVGAADEALYEAKSQGRNRVALAPARDAVDSTREYKVGQSG